MSEKEKLFERITDESIEKRKLFEHIVRDEKEKIVEKTIGFRTERLFSPAEIVSVEDMKEDFTKSLKLSNSKAAMLESINLTNMESIGVSDIIRKCEHKEEISEPKSLPITTTVYPMQNAGENIFNRENAGKGPGGKRKINEDAAIFMYQNGTLIASDGEVMERVGDFYVEIISEKKKVEEIANEENEIVDFRMECWWNIGIVLSNQRYVGDVEGTKLYDFSWLERISQNRVTLRNNSVAKKLLRVYIQQLIREENYISVTEYASSGWKWLKDGTSCYLTSQGAIGMKHLPIKATAGFNLLTKSENSIQIFQEFVGMRRIIPGNLGNAIFLQNYTMAALLTALFKRSGHQIQFCTALIGRTNTKKLLVEKFSREFSTEKGT